MTKLAQCVCVLVLLMALGETRVRPACCVKYHRDPIRPKFLEDYAVQEIGVCKLKAIIFKTVKNRIVCADPNKKWVKKGIKYLENRKQQTTPTKTN